jgi:hypothetical protein
MTQYRNNIFEWEGDDTQPYPNNAVWESGRVLLPVRKTFNCARIIADTDTRQDYYDDVEARRLILARNSARISALFIGGAIAEDEIGEALELNGDSLEDVPMVAAYSGDFALKVDIYGDDVLLFTKEVYSNNKPFRLGNIGIRARAWYIKITGNVRVRRFDMADSIDELKAQG